MADYSDLGFSASPHADLGFTPTAPSALAAFRSSTLAHAPGELQPDQPEGFLHSIYTAPARGAKSVIPGIEHMAQPGWDAKFGGASQILRGAGMTAAPFLLPETAIAAPAATVLAFGVGIPAQAITEGGLSMFGASPGTSALGGDIAGLAAGGLASRLPGSTLGRAVGAGAKAATPDVLAGGAQVAGGELLSHLPGMEWPARIALDYPGARQISRGIGKGIAAGKAVFNPPPVDAVTGETLHPVSGAPGELSNTKVSPAPTKPNLIPPVLGPGNIQGAEEFRANVPPITPDLTQPIAVPHFNKFSQTGGPYKIVSRGGAELGSYDTLADAEKGINDSNFARGAVKIQTGSSTTLEGLTGPKVLDISAPQIQPITPGIPADIPARYHEHFSARGGEIGTREAMAKDDEVARYLVNKMTPDQWLAKDPKTQAELISEANPKYRTQSGSRSRPIGLVSNFIGERMREVNQGAPPWPSK